MVWRRGQSYSEDLRARGLVAVDGGMAARAASVFRVSVSYIYKALIRRRRQDAPENRVLVDVVERWPQYLYAVHLSPPYLSTQLIDALAQCASQRLRELIDPDPQVDKAFAGLFHGNRSDHNGIDGVPDRHLLTRA